MCARVYVCMYAWLYGCTYVIFDIHITCVICKNHWHWRDIYKPLHLASGIGWGQRETVFPGCRARGAQNRWPQKSIFKAFRNNSQRLSLVKLGHRQSISPIGYSWQKNIFLYSCHVLHTVIPDIYIAPLQDFQRSGQLNASNASHLYYEIILSYIWAVWGKIDSVIWPYHWVIIGLTPVVVLVTVLVSYEVIPLNNYWLIDWVWRERSFWTDWFWWHN